MMEFSRQWDGIFKGLKKNCLPKIIHITKKKKFKIEGEIKMFSDRQKLSEVVPTGLTKY